MVTDVVVKILGLHESSDLTITKLNNNI